MPAKIDSWVWDPQIPAGSYRYDCFAGAWRIGPGTPVEEVEWHINLTIFDLRLLHQCKISPLLDVRPLRA